MWFICQLLFWAMLVFTGWLLGRRSVGAKTILDPLIDDAKKALADVEFMDLWKIHSDVKAKEDAAAAAARREKALKRITGSTQPTENKEGA